MKVQTSWWYLFPCLLYLIAILLTEPPFIGDSVFYSEHILQARSGAATVESLWEFGHLLWRPIGYMVAAVGLRTIPDSVAWTPNLKVTLGLAVVTACMGLIAVVLMCDLVRRIAGSWMAAAVAAVLFVWGGGFLAYTQTATPYIPGLMCLVVGIWWQVTADQPTRRRMVVAGFWFALAPMFWFPYVLVLPAAVASRNLIPWRGRDQEGWWPVSGITAIAGAAFAVVGYGIGAAMAGVGGVAEVQGWVEASKHGWAQNRQLLRVVSGCVRLLVDLGADGILLKRYVLRDPFSPVDLMALVWGSLWKLAAFYAFVGSALLLGWRRSRAVVLLFALGAFPVGLFAVFLFEPSSPERFFPVLPFLFLLIAAGWQAEGRVGRCAKSVITVFCLLLPVVNWGAFRTGSSEHLRDARARLEDLRRFGAGSDAFGVLTLGDPIVELQFQRPFDRANSGRPLTIFWIVNLASKDSGQWRQNFGEYVREQWAQGNAVWVLKQVRAPNPTSWMRWIEGDTPEAKWGEISEFFRNLDYDLETALPDGFARVSQSSGNRTRFGEIR